MDKQSFFLILLFLLVLALIFRVIRVRKLLRSEENVVTIKRFPSIGIFFGTLGLIQLCFWVKGLIEYQYNPKYISIYSTGLPFIVLALNSFDYNFITKDGVIIIASKYKWDNIESWYWKKDYYNVATLETYVLRKFTKKSPLKLRKIELNVSQKQRTMVEKCLIQYIGKETNKHY